MDNKVIFVDMAGDWKDTEVSGGAAAGGEKEEDFPKIPEITGVTLGGDGGPPKNIADAAKHRTEKYVAPPVPETPTFAAPVSSPAPAPEKLKEVDATSDMDGDGDGDGGDADADAKIPSPEESEVDGADSESPPVPSRPHSEAANDKKDIDEWSITTDELMGMSPYYMILEKFLMSAKPGAEEKPDGSVEKETIATLLRCILDELKGMRQDLLKK